MRPRLILGLIAVAAWATAAAPLAAQNDERGRATWQVEGLRRGFCVELLLDPSAPVLKSLPAGAHPLPANRASNLHPSLRGVIQGQPEYAAWSPSRLCLEAIDSLRTAESYLTNRKGRHPALFAIWTVSATDSAGTAREVALGLFASSSHMVRSARLAGQATQEARLTVGPVPGEDESGAPRTERRFQVKLEKTTITWDGHPARDSTAVRAPVVMAWMAPAARGGVALGQMSLDPRFSRAMAGSLTIDGKNDFAKALKGSPTRFVGPEYLGGTGVITFGH
jgi:hypothetical protein